MPDRIDALRRVNFQVSKRLTASATLEYAFEVLSELETHEDIAGHIMRGREPELTSIHNQGLHYRREGGFGESPSAFGNVLLEVAAKPPDKVRPASVSQSFVLFSPYKHTALRFSLYQTIDGNQRLPIGVGIVASLG
jgi:hypothetical protein